MKKEETKEVLEIIRIAYPKFYANMSIEDMKKTIELYTEMFMNDSKEEVIDAVKKIISSSNYPPSIAEIKSNINSKVKWELIE